jgi:hypothetical protein
MSALHLTKIAFGCASFDDLRERIGGRTARGEPIRLSTRYKPKRADEIVGGSLYWISQHLFGLRQVITGFEEGEAGRWLICLDPEMIEVEPRPRRAHQGWRYLTGEDAPRDVPQGADAEGRLPAGLEAELAGLGLL